MESLVIVDEEDRGLRAAEKLQAHREGLLHRAFSIFLSDHHGRTLMQRRSPGKYHSGGQWANTCCGHPRPGETVIAAAERRLGEELGIHAILSAGFTTRCRAQFDNGLVENELVHMVFGQYSGPTFPNPEEVSDTKLVHLDEVHEDVLGRPGRNAVWFRHYLADCRPLLDRHLA